VNPFLCFASNILPLFVGRDVTVTETRRRSAHLLHPEEPDTKLRLIPKGLEICQIHSGMRDYFRVENFQQKNRIKRISRCRLGQPMKKMRCMLLSLVAIAVCLFTAIQKSFPLRDVVEISNPINQSKNLSYDLISWKYNFERLSSITAVENSIMENSSVIKHNQSSGNIRDREKLMTKRLWQQTFIPGTFTIPDDMIKLIGSESPSPVGKVITSSIRFPNLKGFWEGVFKEWPHEILELDDAAVNSQGDVMACASSSVWPSRGCSSAPIQFSCNNDITSLDTVVVITQMWGGSFFHAFIEDLSRLAFVLHVRESLAHDIRIHVADAKSELLKMLVEFYGDWQLVSGLIHAKRILLPPSTPCGGHVYSAYNNMFRNSLHLRLQTTVSADKSLVVMHRKKVSSGSRIILNHDDLVSALRKAWNGSISEHFGNEPFHEQLNKFRSSEAVIGPHGASLANIIVMRPGKAVLELLPVNGVNKLNPCYMSMSFTLGLRYFTFYEASSHSESNWEATIPKILEIVTMF
jgi:hypothetical protein